MSTINDGGPAFPALYSGEQGMKLRDYFAANAINGMLLAGGEIGEHAQRNPDKAAAWAYDQADAMLAAREAKK